MEYSPSLGIQIEEEGMKYKDRGDTEAPDFGNADFIKDQSPHELDLSAIVPETGANHLVHISFSFSATNPNEDCIMLGKVGTSGAPFAYSAISELVAGADIRETDMWVMMDSARKIQYMLRPDVTVAWGYVRGWLTD